MRDGILYSDLTIQEIQLLLDFICTEDFVSIMYFDVLVWSMSHPLKQGGRVNDLYYCQPPGGDTCILASLSGSCHAIHLHVQSMNINQSTIFIYNYFHTFCHITLAALRYTCFLFPCFQPLSLFLIFLPSYTHWLFVL